MTQSKTWPDLAPKFPFHLSVVMEELGPDFEQGLAAAQDLGVRTVEFGRLWEEPVGSAPESDWQRAKDLLEKYEIQVQMIAPTTFKGVLLGDVPLENIQDSPYFQAEMASLKNHIVAAKFFGVDQVRIFSFRRDDMVGLGNPSPRLPGGGPFPEEMQAKVAHGLRLACQVAEQHGIILMLENVRSCWGNSGVHTARIVERVAAANLRVIWDPANAFVSGEDDAYPTGYEAVKPYIALVHLKDAVVEDATIGLTSWERLGDGSLDYTPQLQALVRDGYELGLSIETHWSPPGGDPITNTRQTYAGLMDILASL